jgi:hypothetical protein
LDRVGGLARGGAARLQQRGVAGRLGGGDGLLSGPDPGGRGLLGRVGHHPVRVVRGGGVGVEGVQGEPGAGVAEVVLLPPPRAHPPAHLPGGQVVPGGQRVDLPGAAAFGGDPAADLPQHHRLALARPLADAQLHGGVGQVVLMGPAPVIGAGDGAEDLGGQVRGQGPCARSAGGTRPL